MKTRYFAPLVTAAALALMLLPGCTEDPLFPEKGIQVTTTTLPQLQGDAYYELWFSYPEGSSTGKNPKPDHSDALYVSAGKFKIDATGALVGVNGGAAKFAIPTGYNPNLLIDALVTVEKENMSSDVPGARLLAGVFQGSDNQAFARLEATDPEAFGGRLYNDSLGRFTLAAPTSDLASDQFRGIWFSQIIRDEFGSPVDTAHGLNLAPQPLNPDNPLWTYQAWLIRNEGKQGAEYIKLGRFDSPLVPDSTGAGPGAGPNPTRVMMSPGEDFVASASQRLLNDGTYGVAVSVEPIGIELTRPAVIILKRDLIPAGTPAGDTLSLFRQLNPPSLEVRFDR